MYNITIKIKNSKSQLKKHLHKRKIRQKNNITKYRKMKKLNFFYVFEKKSLSDLAMTGLTANFQNIPKYAISYHVVCFAIF